MNNGKIQRRKYFINRRAQGRFILQFVAASALGGGIAVIVFNYFAFKKLDSVLYGMRMPSASTGSLLMEELVISNIFVGLFILAVFAVTARSIFRRLSGPLEKLGQDIARIGQGDLNVTVHLRKNDDFQELATDLNGMVEMFRQRFGRCRETSQEIEKLLSQANLASEGGNPQDAIREVRGKLDQLNKEVKSFSL